MKFDVENGMRASQRAYCRNVQWKVQAESEKPKWFGTNGHHKRTPKSGSAHEAMGPDGVAVPAGGGGASVMHTMRNAHRWRLTERLEYDAVAFGKAE